jgi:type I restriction enzyme S subunit
MFSDVSAGNKLIGDIITPKRGKGLLSKDAVFGDAPVVAGGLEPATYHNIANTTSPVLTISASGANAGFVNLWNIPVWSSDSSFIDADMTNDVYFWYVMLKKTSTRNF